MPQRCCQEPVSLHLLDQLPSVWASFPGRLSHWQHKFTSYSVGSKCPGLGAPWNSVARGPFPVREKECSDGPSLDGRPGFANGEEAGPTQPEYRQREEKLPQRTLTARPLEGGRMDMSWTEQSKLSQGLRVIHSPTPFNKSIKCVLCSRLYSRCWRHQKDKGTGIVFQK